MTEAHNVKVKNRHGRVGVKRPVRPLSEGQQAKRARRARTHPWHQTPAPRVRKIRRGDGRWLFIPKGQPSKAQGKPQPAPVVGSGGLGSSNSVPSGSGGKGSHAHLIVADETAVEPIYLDTKGAAEYISMSVGYVKDHARELGGEKHALRWRFDVVALDRWKAGKK